MPRQLFSSCFTLVSLFKEKKKERERKENFNGKCQGVEFIDRGQRKAAIF